jgi:ABC-type lipoprotein export system ATPase subunit
LIVSFEPERSLVSEYVAAVAKLLEPINEALGGLGEEVRPIRLKYEFDEASFRDSLVRYLVTELTTAGVRTDYIAGELAKLPLQSLGSLVDTMALLGDKATAKVIREYLSDHPNYEQFKLHAELEMLNVARHGRMHVFYDNKPVEQSSFGQRCTAAIVVLLVLGNTPIIIDEPEAHLDSSLIAKYLVGLIKRKKCLRQIVFATHNANFVINADAELIHCLSMGDGKVTTLVSTSIEDAKYRDRLLALEGGKEAFQQRERRYDIA